MKKLSFAALTIVGGLVFVAPALAEASVFKRSNGRSLIIMGRQMSIAEDWRRPFRQCSVTKWMYSLALGQAWVY
jgi:hypothetical protein